MKFQLERFLVFSDALFAIAIALLIINIKPPNLENGISFGNALLVLNTRTPIIIGSIISFYFIALYWTRHHDLMKYAIAYDKKMIVFNFILLLLLAFIPFATAFVFENTASRSSLPLILYNLTHIGICVVSYKMYVYLLNPEHKLCSEINTSETLHTEKEIVFSILVYVVVIIIALINPSIAPMGYALFGIMDLTVKKLF